MGTSTSSRRKAYLYRLSGLFLYAVCIGAVSALVISPPSSSRDYRQLSSLLASTFDAPAELTANKTNKNGRQSLKSKMEVLQWNMIEKSLTEDHTYKRYTSTARRMRGKKYCLLVAKEGIEDEVVALVEMGMSICPVPLHQIDSTDTTNDPVGLRPQPTVGVLCVNPTHKKKGIARALIQKCEEVAEEVWSEKFIFADVEPNNQNALSFFEKCGFDRVVDELGKSQVRNATVSRGRAAVLVPHYLLRKRLIRKMNKEMARPSTVPSPTRRTVQSSGDLRAGGGRERARKFDWGREWGK